MLVTQAESRDEVGMRRGRSALWCGLLSALCLAVVACSDDESNADADSLTIYSSLPLQGDSQSQSEDIRSAIELAVEDHGGRAGDTRIEYVSLDDASEDTGRWEPDLITANAERVAGDPAAIAYIGEFNSDASKVSIPILNEAGLLQISPSNTYVGLTRADGAEAGEPDRYYPTGKRTYGRVVPADHIQAAALVSYMEDKGCSSVYVTNDGGIYGKGLADQLQAIGAEGRLEVFGNVTLTDETFASAPDTVRSSGADCYFDGSVTQSDAAELFNNVGAANPDITMFGGDGLAELAFTEAINPEFQPQIFLTTLTLPADHYPEAAQAFFEDFEAAYGHAPEPYAIYGYEAMNVALLAIENAGDDATPDPAGRAAVVEQFFQIADRESVLGTYSIDENGDTTLTDYGGYAIGDAELIFDRVITATGVLPAGTARPIPTTEAVGTPFPDGVYETTPSAEAWIAAGFPEEAGIRHRVTFENGRLDDRCVLADGTTEPCFIGTYRSIGDHEVEFGDRSASFRLRWRIEGDTLTFEMDPDEGDEGDRIVFTSAPWTRVG
jgi:branched-chain amino acid transport system substrate-binding protein